ncbi:MAG: hypothetical protein DRO23_09660 [Thermoprotei archaeon]|nr:MAG: hypothetical protein DRO23_09660 [Thermoprotei archaeon]
MEAILDLLAKDHVEFTKILSEIGKLSRGLNKKLLSPEQKFKAMKDIVFIIHKFSIFVGMLEKHRELEELTVFKMLEKKGFKNEAKKLRETHVLVANMLKDLEKEFSEFRERAKPLEETAAAILKMFMNIRDVFMKHMEREEKIFKKLK